MAKLSWNKLNTNSQSNFVDAKYLWMYQQPLQKKSGWLFESSGHTERRNVPKLTDVLLLNFFFVRKVIDH